MKSRDVGASSRLSRTSVGIAKCTRTTAASTKTRLRRLDRKTTSPLRAVEQRPAATWAKRTFVERNSHRAPRVLGHWIAVSTPAPLILCGRTWASQSTVCSMPVLLDAEILTFSDLGLRRDRLPLPERNPRLVDSGPCINTFCCYFPRFGRRCSRPRLSLHTAWAGCGSARLHFPLFFCPFRVDHCCRRLPKPNLYYPYTNMYYGQPS